MNKILLFLKNNFFVKLVYNIVYIIGKNAISFNSAIGRIATFSYKMFCAGVNKQFFLKNFLNSLFVNGFCSIPVVGFTGFFIGAVLTLQLFNSLKMFGIESQIPYVVLIALMKELSPIMTGVMIIARVASSMSAEIGTMSSNNQIDVLTSMSINKYRFLYIPRILSLIVAQPILTTISIITGVIGSFIIATKMFDFTDIYFCNLIYEGFEFSSYLVGVVKGFVFGFIISVISCYKGNYTKDGAYGVKQTTISVVVLCCVYILMFNFFITLAMG